MTARISHQQLDQATTAATRARTIPSSSTVMNVVVRVAGIVSVRLDLAHVGTAEQQLGLSLGTVLIYLNSRELHQAGEKAAGRLAGGALEK